MQIYQAPHQAYQQLRRIKRSINNSNLKNKGIMNWLFMSISIIVKPKQGNPTMSLTEKVRS